MYKFFVVRISGSMTVVDVFNPMQSVSGWLTYWPVSASSLKRLRLLFRNHKGSVHVVKGRFSILRVEAMKSQYGRDWREGGLYSLDSLPTRRSVNDDLR